MVEVKIEGFKIVFCICDGRGSGEWKLHQEVRMSVFIPKDFLRLFKGFDEDVLEDFRIMGSKIIGKWGYNVEEPRDSSKYKSCGVCPLAPRDTEYEYCATYAYFNRENLFDDFIKKTMEEIQRAYEFYKSLPTFRQKQVEIDIVTKITIAPTKDRVELLAEELKNQK